MMSKTVNQMIIEAFLTDSRKRNPENKKELEALGYSVSKYDGCIKVTNNGNYVMFDYKKLVVYVNAKNHYRVDCRHYGKNKGYYVSFTDVVSKIDFEGALNRPEYRKENWTGWARASYDHEKSASYQRMEHLIWSRNYHKKEKENARDALKKAIERYERDIEYHEKSFEDDYKTICEMLKR